MLSITKTKRRLPSLYTLHGEDLDWSVYQTQTKEFQEWMTTIFNPDRDGVAHQLEGGNLSKIDFATSSCLIHLAVEHHWKGPLSYEWLLEHEFFDDIYTTYAQHLHEHRANSFRYIGKQLGDLQHSLAWASKKEWEWGMMPPETAGLIMHKLDALKRQYYSEGAKGSQVRKALSPPKKECDLQTYVTKVNQLVSDCLKRLCNKWSEELTQDEKAEVVECTMLKLAARGGRGVDLHSVWLALDQEWVLQWLCDHPNSAETKLLIRRESTWELVVYSKGHLVHEALTDATPILDLFWRCFPHLVYGDRLFTPTFHGARWSKANVQECFETTAKFDEMFEAVCQRRVGVRIRPYALRRYNATHLHAIEGASDEVRRSHCSLMGTGLGNLETTYDTRSDVEKGFLASIVQRFQFDPRFDTKVHNRILPALGTQGGLVISVARLVRQNQQGSELFAIFQEVDTENGFLELSDRMVQTNQAQGFPLAKLVCDPLSSRQRWRARDAAIQAAEDMLNKCQINRHEFAVESMLAGPLVPQPKDMVYVPAQCTIAEVIEVLTNSNEAHWQLEVRTATELEASNSMESTYRFLHNAQVQHVRVSQVIFPIDLSFNAKNGNFLLRKSMSMQTI